MSNRFFLSFVVTLLGLLLQISCVGIAPTQEMHVVDSLNHKAYTFRYRDLDSSFLYAHKAYESVKYYTQGKATACNHLAFYYFMKMSFEEALQWHNKVYEITQNEIELLVADIGQMKIYQRTAQNKEFYDYRNSALVRMKQIEEDYNVFVEKNEKLRLYYAYSEFYFTSTIYHYYLQQEEDAIEVFKEYEKGVESNIFWSLEKEAYIDESQKLKYHYIKGITQLSNGDYPEEIALSSFDQLFYTWFLSTQNDFLLFEGYALQGLASLMIRPSDYLFFAEWRVTALKQLNMPINDKLPLRLSEKALSIFQYYKDLYQIAGAYVTIGEYLNIKGDYVASLDSLKKSLQEVNNHHQQYYDSHHSSHRLDTLMAYDSTIYEGNYPEILWIEDHLLTVPEWIARIREQLSFTYAGLGNKIASDFNRNIYLDILDYTRQDKEIESRYGALKQEESILNIILIIAFSVASVFLVLFLWFYRRSKKKNSEHVKKLQVVLELCKKITATVLVDSKNNRELARSLLNQIEVPIKTILKADVVRLGLISEDDELLFYDSLLTDEFKEQSLIGKLKATFSLYNSAKEENLVGVLEIYAKQDLTKEQYALVSIVVPYLSWSIENSMFFFYLGEEQELLDKKRYIHEQHIAKNVRENVNKKACLAVVNGIQPYIDRIINEIEKLKKPYFFNDLNTRRGKYEYIEELAMRINKYNGILTLWIQIKQGTINLHIESFSLQEVFDVVTKGAKWFDLKHQIFTVDKTKSWVRADRVLTLFMINTLLDNARKYTNKGGRIHLSSEETDEYIEISIHDTGIGLSGEDIHCIINEKVYNAQLIGVDQSGDKEDLLAKKGSGFGLMNCKGIIEKYRKISQQFKVSKFGVESTKGEGSRFYFRLPRGVKRILFFLSLFFFPFSFSFSRTGSEENYSNRGSLVSKKRMSHYLLDEASRYADSVYYANVDMQYEKALDYVQVVVTLLNKHRKFSGKKLLGQLNILSKEKPAEIAWWNAGFETDYHIILDVRNEAAVAFMALKNWDGYQYNNEAFTKLYKMLGVDSSLDQYCKGLERSRSGKVIGIILILLFPLLFGIAYYFIYIRKRLLYRWNLEQLLEVNKIFFSASTNFISNGEMEKRGEDTLKLIPIQITKQSFESINELFSVDRIGLAVYNESSKKLEYSYSPPKKELASEIKDCFSSEKKIIKKDRYAYPLWINIGETHQKVGVFYFEKKDGLYQKTDEVLLQLMISYLAIVVFNTIIKLANRYREIELAQEEAQRASWEEGVLHIQNMVLDNCLSTLKHETIYYPNKINHLINRLRNDNSLATFEEKKLINDIDELIVYYKDIFDLLRRWANKQLDEITFRRKVINVDDLLSYALEYFNKRKLPNNNSITFQINSLKQQVVGDKNQLMYLLENLIDATLENKSSGCIYLKAKEEGAFIVFTLIDERNNRTDEELRTLFYPSLKRLQRKKNSENTGIEYLLCKQIIREQEEYVGRRGCRIQVEKNKKGGDCVLFSLPKR